MLVYEIANGNLSDEDEVIKQIERTVQVFGLTVANKTTLSTKKGSVHYHLKKGKQAGVLEVTYWPSMKKLWVEIHKNRKTDWNQGMIHPFSKHLAALVIGENVSPKRAASHPASRSDA